MKRRDGNKGERDRKGKRDGVKEKWSYRDRETDRETKSNIHVLYTEREPRRKRYRDIQRERKERAMERGREREME